MKKQPLIPGSVGLFFRCLFSSALLLFVGTLIVKLVITIINMLLSWN